MTQKYQLTIAIPCFNEERLIVAVLESFRSYTSKYHFEIILIDDGSTDGSLELAQAVKMDNLQIIKHQKNLGKTAAINSAITVAQGEYFIVQDGDLEYDIKDIFSMLDLALKENEELVWGYRKGLFKNSKKSQFHLRLGTMGLTKIVNFLYNKDFYDLSSCYKLIKTDLFKEFKLEKAGFEYCYETTCKLLNLDKKFLQYPVYYNPRENEQGKKIKSSDGWKCFLTIIEYGVIENKKYLKAFLLTILFIALLSGLLFLYRPR